jgi:hypothetical protein
MDLNNLGEAGKWLAAWEATKTGSKVVWNLVGPITKSAGKGLDKYTKQVFKNVGSVFADAKKKLSIRNKKGGGVPARVGRAAFEQAKVCEDAVIASYLGGVMASSHTKAAKDDMAVSYLATIESLSSYQLRAHAILYASMLQIPIGVYPNLRTEYFREFCTIVFEQKHFLKAMGLTDSEKSAVICRHGFTGLNAKRLIEGGVKTIFPNKDKGTRLSGPTLFRTMKAPEIIHTPFRFFNPTVDGIELFVWAMGYGDNGIAAYRPDFLKGVTMPVKLIPLHISAGKTTFGP